MRRCLGRANPPILHEQQRLVSNEQMLDRPTSEVHQRGQRNSASPSFHAPGTVPRINESVPGEGRVVNSVLVGWSSIRNEEWRVPRMWRNLAD